MSKVQCCLLANDCAFWHGSQLFPFLFFSWRRIFHEMTQILYGSDHMWVGAARLRIQDGLFYSESHRYDNGMYSLYSMYVFVSSGYVCIVFYGMYWSVLYLLECIACFCQQALISSCQDQNTYQYWAIHLIITIPIVVTTNPFTMYSRSITQNYAWIVLSPKLCIC